MSFWLRCPRKVCRWVWLYKGKNTILVSCPNCMRKMPIENNQVEPKSARKPTLKSKLVIEKVEGKK